MPLTMVAFDPDADPGERFPGLDVREEIGEVVPITIDPGSITESKLANGSVTHDKLGADAVDDTNIADHAIHTEHLTDLSVTADKIAAASITPVKTGTGIPTAANNTGAAIGLRLIPLTAAQYAAIGSPDPNSLYFIT